MIIHNLRETDTRQTQSSQQALLFLVCDLACISQLTGSYAKNSPSELNLDLQQLSCSDGSVDCSLASDDREKQISGSGLADGWLVVETQGQSPVRARASSFAIENLASTTVNELSQYGGSISILERNASGPPENGPDLCYPQ